MKIKTETKFEIGDKVRLKRKDDREFYKLEDNEYGVVDQIVFLKHKEKGTETIELCYKLTSSSFYSEFLLNERLLEKMKL